MSELSEVTQITLVQTVLSPGNKANVVIVIATYGRVYALYRQNCLT